MINISIIENDGAFSERMKRVLNKFFINRGIDYGIDISEYSSVPENKTGLGDYCFINTEFSDVDCVAAEIKRLCKYTHIIFIGEDYSQKNIDMAVNGYFWGLSGYIIKSFSDAEILNLLDCLFMR